jgi:hypothetical protein
MTGYTKLFNSIVGSTIWREGPATKVVWITLLALADRDGIVESSVPGLANYASVSIAETETALQKLQSPDLYSRSPEHEGRRIEPVDGGWLILNHQKYRLKMSKEDIRERDRVRKQRQREQKKLSAMSGTRCDNPDLSGESDIHKAEGKKQKAENNINGSGCEEGEREERNLTQFDPTEAAMGYCHAFSVAGRRNYHEIEDAIEVEGRVSPSLSPESIANLMIAARNEYLATEGRGFEWPAVAFITSGTWKKREGWTKAKPSAQAIPMRRASAEIQRQLREG